MGLGSKRIGVEIGLGKSGVYFWAAEFEALKATLPKATFIDAANVIAAVRLIKAPEEIAVMRRTPVGTVKTQMRTALQKLRRVLKET